LVAAGFSSLDDERIDSCGRGVCGFRSRRYGAPNLTPGRSHRGDHFWVGTSECERNDRGPHACDQFELCRPVVVAPARLAQRNAVPFGFDRDVLRISGEGALVNLVL